MKIQPEDTMRLIISILLSFVSLAASASDRSSKLETALARLDTVVAARSGYLAGYRASLDSLRRVTSPDDARGLRRIATGYRDIDVDSAFRYFGVAKQAAEDNGDKALYNMLLLDYADMLSDNLLFADAIAVVDSVDRSALDNDGLIRYHAVLSNIYIDAAQSLDAIGDKSHYTRKAQEELDSLGFRFPENSRERRLARAQADYLAGNYTLAAGELIDILDNITPDYPAYAIVTAMLARYYADNPAKREEYLYYLTLSAITDVMKADGHPLSIITLAGELYDDGDIDRAHDYLEAAAEAYKMSHLAMKSGDMLAAVTQVHRAITDREEHTARLYALVAAGVFLLLVVAVCLLIRLRSISGRKSDGMRSMEEAIASRDQYITQLLNICAAQVEGMEDFCRLAGRKLKAGQAKDLYDMIESGKVMQEQTERFFTVFDAAVLRIFPNFTEELNELLLPDRRLYYPSHDKLSPEQRIVAFMRLGVTDSARIAKFLGLSLNTVYTYRNRIKNRARDRDNFESAVLQMSKTAYS